MAPRRRHPNPEEQEALSMAIKKAEETDANQYGQS